jgi:transcriptional regulator with XRE-family HTH domain
MLYDCFIGNYEERMTNLRKLLAFNMKEERRKLGISQAKLAEKADLSTQYVAMIELGRKFPSLEKMELIAAALEIDTPELFSMPPSVEKAVLRYSQEILADLEKTVGETVNAAVAQLVESHLKDVEVMMQTIQKKSRLKKKLNAPNGNEPPQVFR